MKQNGTKTCGNKYSGECNVAMLNSWTYQKWLVKALLQSSFGQLRENINVRLQN